MKITKVPDAYDMNIYEKKKALKDCYICPFCGESRMMGYHNGKVCGIEEGLLGRQEWVKTGWFKKELMHIDIFICHTCGARWESEPYKNV